MQAQAGRVARIGGHKAISAASRQRVALAERVFRAAPQRAYSTSDTEGGASTSGDGWRVKMLYDGECPLCMREVSMLRRRDAAKGHIKFVDIAEPGYDPAANSGISYRQAMERIHAILPDGSTVTDVEVFRRLYEQVGLGWIYAATRNPAVEKAANALYGVWAKYRMQVTGRPDLEVVLAEKRACGAGTGSSAHEGRSRS